MTFLFLHIPKTAGSSLTGELQRALQPSLHLFLDMANNPPSAAPALMAEKVRRHAEAINADRYRLVAGHFRYRDLVNAGVRGGVVTVLRHPVSRVVSSFHYSRQAGNPQQQFYLDETDSLEAFASLGKQQNVLHDWLSAYPGEPLDAVIDRVLTDFAFVGLTETYDRDLARLMRLIGAEAPANLRERVGSYPPPSDATRDLIAELNPVDMALYTRVAAALDERLSAA